MYMYEIEEREKVWRLEYVYYVHERYKVSRAEQVHVFACMYVCV